jgi:DNA-binding response OmpR family regulator
MNVIHRWALLASDCTTLPDIRTVLGLAGYHVQNVYSVEAAAFAIAQQTPDLVVLGPFQNSAGLETLMRTLHQCESQLMVLSNDVDTIAAAHRFSFSVRSPAQRVYHEPPHLRALTLN